MKRYRWAGCLLIAFLLISFFAIDPVIVSAAGEGNMDTGGGGFGQGEAKNYWSGGNDGVRVTIVQASDGTAVAEPIDLTNKSPSNVIVHFTKRCKTSYVNGASLTPDTGAYVYYNPVQVLPSIVTDGNTNIEQIKSYFTDEQILQSICRITGFDYDDLISGDYKVMVEPLAYMTLKGVFTALTATEAALYDRLLGGFLKLKMTSLTHKNLPLAMFLETPDLGYPAWNGSRTKIVSNDDIVAALGIGIVRFNDILIPATSVDYVYRVDTDVVTAVEVSGGQSDPDNPVDVSFEINGATYTATNVYYPKDSSQLAWVQWHTPSTPQIINITISASGDGIPGVGSIVANVVDLNGNDPPNPTADDRNDSYDAGNAIIPINTGNTSVNWSVWVPRWHSEWVWCSDWQWEDEGHAATCVPGCTVSHGYWYDDGDWEDKGWWEFDNTYYSASISAAMTLYPDAMSPTASATTIKSGYGVNISVSSSITTNDSSAVTGTQTAVSYFPEFYYRTYWRMLDKITSGMNADYEFKTNPFSTYNRRTHFTPIWMKDGQYTVYTYILDCWTPGGMLSMDLTDSVTISGDLWKDWHIAPRK